MFKIEKVKSKEIPSLAALYHQLVNQANEEKMLEVFDKIAVNSAYTLLGAKVGEQLAGSLMGVECYNLGRECRPFMVVENVIVDEKYRGKGIGKALMAAIEEEARQRNCCYLMLVSSMHRKEAHVFYDAIGYPADAVEGFKKFL